MKGDERGMRVALVSDAILNPPPGAPDRLAELAAEGWGVIGLPPRDLPGAAAEAWVSAALDQAAELARHGATVGVLLDGEERWTALQLGYPPLGDVLPG
jgi:hypothetical protein